MLEYTTFWDEIDIANEAFKIDKNKIKEKFLKAIETLIKIANKIMQNITSLIRRVYVNTDKYVYMPIGAKTIYDNIARYSTKASFDDEIKKEYDKFISLDWSDNNIYNQNEKMSRSQINEELNRMTNEMKKIKADLTKLRNDLINTNSALFDINRDIKEANSKYDALYKSKYDEIYSDELNKLKLNEDKAYAKNRASLHCSSTTRNELGLQKMEDEKYNLEDIKSTLQYKIQDTERELTVITTYFNTLSFIINHNK